VDLVDSLTADGSDGNNVATDAEGNLLLWSGVDPQLYEAICDALDAASVSHRDTDREFGLPSLGQKVILIWVNESQWTNESEVLEKTLKGPRLPDRDDLRMQSEATRLDPFGIGRRVYSALPERRTNPFAAVADESLLQDTETYGEPVPDDIASDFNPEDATAEVWSGADPDTAETVRVCLRENGIGCVVEDRGGERVVLVTLESAPRAKQIVDEIVRGTPS